MTKYIFQVLISILLVHTSISVAQKSDSFLVTGYIDTYYAYDFNKPRSHDRQFTNSVSRHNEFNVNHAYVLTTYNNDKSRAVFGLQLGNFPDRIYAQEPSEFYKFIYQAYGGVKISKGVWLDMGVFPGHLSYGSIESIKNELYTRSLSSEFMPVFQTGARVMAELSSKISISGYVLNGWQNIAETNKSKALGMSLYYRPSDELELGYSNYFGDEGTRFTNSKFRVFNHIHLRHQTSEQFHYVLEFNIGRQEPLASNQTESVYFFNILAQHKISEKFSLSWRFEHIDDENQILISTNNFDGFEGQVYSISFNYHVTENAVFRVESKHYDTGQMIFNEGPTVESGNYMLAGSMAIKF